MLIAITVVILIIIYKKCRRIPGLKEAEVAFVPDSDKLFYIDGKAYDKETYITYRTKKLAFESAPSLEKKLIQAQSNYEKSYKFVLFELEAVAIKRTLASKSEVI